MAVNHSKILALGLLLAALALPFGAKAQNGLFSHQAFGDDNTGSFTHQAFGDFFMGDFTHQAFGDPTGGSSGSTGSGYGGLFSHQGFGDSGLSGGGYTGGFTHQGFGDTEAPLGGGSLILLSAAMGYAALKRRKNNKSNKKNSK